MIDLHVHSTCSDGSLTPQQLIDEAARKGIVALSICDHDNIDAYSEELQLPDGFTLLTGCELSSRLPSGPLHLLAYGVDCHNQRFAETLQDLQQARRERNRVMIDQLHEAGLPITYEQVSRLAGGTQIGRPHMAQALVKSGIVATVSQAFTRYLHDGSPYYVERRDLAPTTALNLIHIAGGVAVMAHPYQTKLSPPALNSLIKSLVAVGLDELEVWYGRHSRTQVAQYRGLAKKYHLLMTAGSDFHGTTKPDVAVGDVAPDAPDASVILASVASVCARYR